MTTGATNTIRVDRPTIAAEPGIHHVRGKRRMTPTASAAPPAAIRLPIAVDFATSPAHGPQLCVDRPNSRERRSETAASGSPTTVKPALTAAPAAPAPASGRRP